MLELAPRRAHAHLQRAALRLDRLIEHLEQTLSGGDALLQRTGDADELAQRLRDAHQGGNEAEQVAHGHAAVDGVGDGDREHEREPRRRSPAAPMGLEIPLVRISRMFERRLCSLTASNWRLRCSWAL